MSIIYLKYSSEELSADSDTYFNNLRCSGCGETYSKSEVQTYCHQCNKPLLAEYNLPLHFDKNMLKGRVESMWRYREFLPVENETNIVSLGEGWTPINPMQQLGKIVNSSNIILKDEGFNPTGSFKARGLSMAISKAKEYGIERVAIPTAGNAGGALAAYCATSGMEGMVIMPEHTPDTFKWECQFLNTQLKQVQGTISDCGKELATIRKDQDWFDVSTMKEPYRLEGKKTMGYEIAEQMDWTLPDVIVYPHWRRHWTCWHLEGLR